MDIFRIFNIFYIFVPNLPIFLVLFLFNLGGFGRAVNAHDCKSCRKLSLVRIQQASKCIICSLSFYKHTQFEVNISQKNTIKIFIIKKLSDVKAKKCAICKIQF